MRSLVTLLLVCRVWFPAGEKGETKRGEEPSASPVPDWGDGPVPGSAEATAEPTKPLNNRIVIKTGFISLVVVDAGDAMARINALLKEYGAFEAGRESYAVIPGRELLEPSEVSALSLTLKVPADRFESFVEAIKQVGSYTQEQTNATDVTLQYVDLEARLASNKKVEARLQAHLKSASNVKDIVEVEKELGRVREQIESLTAQFRVLRDQVAYSSLSVEISVRPDWIPPSQRSLWEEISSSLGNSLSALLTTGRMGVVYGLALLPWLIVFGGLGFGLLALRRLRRRRKAARK